jgi:N-acetylneuraminic acid mutarotase
VTLRALLVAASVVLSLAPVAEAAQTTVQPASGKAGTRVSVRGSGFAPARAGWVRLGARPAKPVRTNRGGSFSTSLTVPRMGIGQKQLVARIAGVTVVNSFVVTSAKPRSSSRAATSTGRRVLLSPTAGRTGAPVTVAASGFPPGSLIRISFAGSLQDSGTASARGTFTAAFAVPNVAAGTRTVTVASGRSTVRLGFRVLPPPASAGCTQPSGSGSWSAGPEDMPVGVLDAGGAVVAGKLYAVGGKTRGATGDVHQRTLYVYSPPPIDRWTRGPDLPSAYPAVENVAAVAFGGKLYVFGGATSAFSGAVAKAAVYDPATRAWAMLRSMNVPRGGATAQALGGKIYVAGGMDGTGASLASVEVYDPAGNEWTSTTAMDTRRDNPGSAVLRDANDELKLYVFGGRTRNAGGAPPGNETLASVEMYDPGTKQWTARAPMPTGRRVVAVGTLNGCAQVMGGERKPSGGTFAETEEYNPVTNDWRTLAPMPTPRHGAVAGTINGVVYVAGGGPSGGSTFTPVNEAFRFS